MSTADLGSLLLLSAIGAALWLLFGFLWMLVGLGAFLGICLIAEDL